MMDEQRVVKKFVQEKPSIEFVFSLVDKLADMATITPSGEVSVKIGGTTRDRVALITIARFLANLIKEKIGTEIKAEISCGEVARQAGIKRPVAVARLKELKDDGLLESPVKGVYRVRSVYQAEKWITSLHSKYVTKKGEYRKSGGCE
jgi:DNA-binding transcriptional ArsR family regulator